MQPVAPPRELTEAEAAVVSAALEQAPVGEVPATFQASVPRLRVVGRCECGCGSLFFAGIEGATGQYRVADGLGYTDDGEEIGVILWASEEAVVHMELYNYSERPARLPTARSVRPFQESRRVRE